jgi:hypothetical protein
MIPGETVLSGAAHPGTELEMFQTPAGAYYLGFRDKDGAPYSRETEYMGSDACRIILDTLRTKG